MSKLNIKIEDNDIDSTTVVVTMTNDVADKIIESLNVLFEIEMIGAGRATTDTETVIGFVTTNEQSIKIMREGAIRMAFEQLGESKN